MNEKPMTDEELAHAAREIDRFGGDLRFDHASGKGGSESDTRTTAGGSVELTLAPLARRILHDLIQARAGHHHLKRREAYIIDACERVADGGQYRADIVSAIQRIRSERDRLTTENAILRGDLVLTETERDEMRQARERIAEEADRLRVELGAARKARENLKAHIADLDRERGAEDARRREDDLRGLYREPGGG